MAIGERVLCWCAVCWGVEWWVICTTPYLLIAWARISRLVTAPFPLYPFFPFLCGSSQLASESGTVPPQDNESTILAKGKHKSSLVEQDKNGNRTTTETQ